MAKQSTTTKIEPVEDNYYLVKFGYTQYVLDQKAALLMLDVSKKMEVFHDKYNETSYISPMDGSIDIKVISKEQYIQYKMNYLLLGDSNEN